MFPSNIGSDFGEVKHEKNFEFRTVKDSEKRGSPGDISDSLLGLICSKYPLIQDKLKDPIQVRRIQFRFYQVSA